ncbi:catalase [Mycobacterium sp. 1274756.6]|uniref:catalase n=1 Tax=Mycobacterium sp. 1274756.6 TaxID=1834076 RepID=UPI000AACA845|nr:catalase [Mycobacterium sp. 1274756.6]
MDNIGHNVRSKAEQLKGRAKEVAGSAMGDDELMIEGHQERAAALAKRGRTAKTEQLDQFREENTGKPLTSDTGTLISDDQHSLRAGRRGPTLLQDTHFYRKQSRFNRERIPEKVVHARGFGVHGEFELTKSLEHVTRAHFLRSPGTKTPTFVRFSNFIGSKGSKDTAVDVRGFATKFYTEEGNYDNLALSFAVFILQDAMKFVDFVHSIKPDPASDTPQATGGHDGFWDYVTSNPESAHMIMWLMSMRGRPRSWRMMEAWPINTFRLTNEQGKSTFARFVWKPLLGVHGLLLEEANILGGVDPDFHRHDLVEALENGAYPEYELGVQLIAEEDEFKYDFDILDDTKLWPEDVVPVEIVGKMTLNRLMDNFFAEEEQAVFDPSNLVPGIQMTNDPSLQGRSFAYRDTEYHRLGANMNEIPINRPIVETNHNHRDGYDRYRIDADEVDYRANSLADNTPSVTPAEQGGYANYPGPVEGHITRELPSERFNDHFSQARLFWNSMADFEKADLLKTFSFHLQKVKSKAVRQQTVEMFGNVDQEMAAMLARNIGVNPPSGDHVPVTESSPVLSTANTAYSPATLKVGVLIAEDFDDKEVGPVLTALKAGKAVVQIVSDRLGAVTGASGMSLEVDETFFTSHPTLFDAYYVVGGRSDQQPLFDDNVREFVRQGYKFYKPIGLAKAGQAYLGLADGSNPTGVVTAAESDFSERFMAAVTQQRFWDRV